MFVAAAIDYKIDKEIQEQKKIDAETKRRR